MRTKTDLEETQLPLRTPAKPASNVELNAALDDTTPPNGLLMKGANVAARPWLRVDAYMGIPTGQTHWD